MSTLQEENFSESKEFALCCTKNIGDPQKSVDLPHTTDTTIPTAPLHSDSQPMSTEGKNWAFDDSYFLSFS